MQSVFNLGGVGGEEEGEGEGENVHVEDICQPEVSFPKCHLSFSPEIGFRLELANMARLPSQ